MLYACAARLDVMFWGKIFWELNTPYLYSHETFIISLHQYSVMSAYLMLMKLYETPIEIGLSVVVFFKFHCILFDMAFLEITLRNSSLRLALRAVPMLKLYVISIPINFHRHYI
jgi:hypothetical protein